MTTMQNMHAQQRWRGNDDRMIPSSPTVVLMPFEDVEEERLWDEIVEARAAGK